MKNRSTKYWFLSISLIIALFLRVQCEISHLKYYEAEHALSHVIKSLKDGKLDEMDDSYQQRFTNSNQCNLCQKRFKNSSYLQLHTVLHHPIVNQTPSESMLAHIFDKRIKNEFRFEMCIKLLNLLDIDSMMKRNEQSKELSPSNHQKNKSKYSLTTDEIVDACTIIAYGAYHQPLWRFWIKCTLIFIFFIVFLVYYASIVDQINEKYFPKKEKKKISFSQ